MHTAPEACLLYMLLEQCAFQIWFWNIFDLEYSSRLLMVQDHMALDHQSPGQNLTKSFLFGLLHLVL